MPEYSAGDAWTYRTPQGYEASRLVIGAHLTFTEHEPVLCCAVTNAPVRQKDGSHQPGTIAFLPMTLEAFKQSVVSRDGEASLPKEFKSSLDAWQNDPRGLTYFTVFFEGHLEQMIARQMAQIVGVDAQKA